MQYFDFIDIFLQILDDLGRFFTKFTIFGIICGLKTDSVSDSFFSRHCEGFARGNLLKGVVPSQDHHVGGISASS